MNGTTNAVAAANIVECVHRFDRFVAKTVEHIYRSYMEGAQMRLAPTKPSRRRMHMR
ncbi:MAG: hypothetical protein WB868_06750 [Xanthobacteraceae bacterium]